MAVVETPRTRRRMVEQAGWRTTSWMSVVAGMFVAFGAVALLAAAAGAAGSALGLDTDGISTNEWRQAGIAGAAVGAIVVFGAFWFGGYTAGRMGRRAGARHGLLVFLVSAVVIAAIALIGWGVSDQVNVADDLRDNGVPTDGDTWADIGLGAGIAVFAAMLLGAIMGGIQGDRWHGRLATAVIEHRDAEREREVERTRRQQAAVGTTPADRTDLFDRDGDDIDGDDIDDDDDLDEDDIDLRQRAGDGDRDAMRSIEEERETRYR